MKKAWIGWAVLAFALLAAADPQDATERKRDPLTPESGLVERTGVALMLFDVEVTDEDGMPVRGLTAGDFSVRLNGRSRPIYSVDDLCDCPDEAAAAVTASEAPGESSPALTEPPSQPADAAPSLSRTVGARQPGAPRFILYFDFSQLQMSGRVDALAEARRWVRDVMRPTDEVMIVAYSTLAGVRTLADFTKDRQVLLTAIDRTDENRDLVDPFPSGRWLRLKNCCDCCRKECGVGCGRCPGCKVCDTYCLIDGARAEYYHGKHSLEALSDFLATLERIPGRKALLLFHQNGSMLPARHYPADEFRAGDLVTEVDRVGAEANLARTAIHSAFAGDNDNLAVNLGANLADFTGGSYNRGTVDLARSNDSAGRGCACLYRLALEPPERDVTRIYRVKVEAAGRVVPFRYRLTYLDEAERWMREARVVLSNPAGAADLPVVAALLPVAGQEGGWDVRVQVALSPNSLVHLPLGRKQTTKANWEVGALLTDTRRRKAWEMLGVSELFRRGEGETLTLVLHERVFEGLRPGEYELRAFVRDRVANLYGGARAEIDLPRSNRKSLVGPVLMRAQTPYLQTALPLLKEAGDSEIPESRPVRRGVVPVEGRSIRAGEPLEFLGWVCFERDKEAIYDVRRFISLNDEPIFRFEPPEMRRAGDCASFIDRLDTSPMNPGAYTYHARWDTGATDERLETELSFEVLAADPAGVVEPTAGSGL